MKILYLYLTKRVLLASLSATLVLTLILVLGNAFKRIFELLTLHDVPLTVLFELIFLLIPQALTFTLPWGLLVGTLIVLGRFSYEHELEAVYSAGISLLTLVAPIIIASLAITLFCFLNNAMLAPKAMTAFKTKLLNLGRTNPTAILREGEMIDQLRGYRIYITRKTAQTIEGVHLWELGEDSIPKRSIRAERGTIAADFDRMFLTITLLNARQEERGRELTNLAQIRQGLKAQQLPISVSFDTEADKAKIQENITIHTWGRLQSKIFGKHPVGANLIPLLTELQKRLSFSFAPFTFVLVGIPLALRFKRRETSAGIVLSLGIVITYYLLVIVAMSLKNQAGAWPELIVWLPNLIFEAVGILLLWRASQQR